jgi:Trp operon repressor
VPPERQKWHIFLQLLTSTPSFNQRALLFKINMTLSVENNTFA